MIDPAEPMNSVEAREAGSAVSEQKPKLEAGYIMTMIVILMPVLIGMLALAVDGTYYWFRGVQIQRAADAAALAGVTRMPKYEDAVRQATEIAKRNGFVDGQDSMVVTPERIPDNNKRFKITISDDNVGIFFGRIFQTKWSIKKVSTAEYISNIPLGSKENAIGTGYLADSGQVQNFWLAVSGPCAPKEAGDQFLSRWDGNAVNGFELDAAGNAVTIEDPVGSGIFRPKERTAAERYALLCDVDPAGLNTGPVYLKAKRDEKQVTSPGLFPTLAQNLEYQAGKTGYDYIVDVPCWPITTATPPPCDNTSMPGDLIIQVYDPVFNPDSVQRWAQKVGIPSRYTNEVEDTLKPDKVGLLRPPIQNCHSSTVGAGSCTTPSPSIGVNNPNGWDVRVNTDFRVFPPDNSPLDYSDDNAMILDDAGAFVAPGSSNIVTGNGVLGTDSGPTAADKFATPKEVTDKAVRRFKSCISLTDPWTSTDGTYFYSVPRISSTNFSPAPVGTTGVSGAGVGVATPVTGTPDVLTMISDTSTATPAECGAYGSKWVTIKRVPATNKRGRYRLNLRTIDAVNSFGFNSFGVRAFFVPAATPVNAITYPSCLIPTPNTCLTEQRASVAGDSTMSVFASVNDVGSFYLAQLSPAKLFRNKTVVVSLWDPGEGASKLQILRPKQTSGEVCPAGLVDATSSVYCVQRIQWTVGRTGVAAYDPTNPDVGLTNSVEYQDVCADKGRPLPAETVLPDGLEVANAPTVTDGTTIDGCTAVQPPIIKNSRQYKGEKTEQKFNDRLVTVAIKIPENYGCNVGTGIPDLVTGDLIPCVDGPDPEGGWWKIKYYPKSDGAGGYLKMTDRTTWSVSLRGDPVHLVVSGQ
jgi:hypothetical protein